MFALQIQTVDSPQPFPTTIATTSSAGNGPKPNSNLSSSSSGSLNLSELRGIAHLFRHLPSSTSTTISNPISRTTTAFIVAAPNYLSPDDFLLFCGTHLADFSDVMFLKNDGIENSYSVLINLVNQLAADGFYCSFNGKRFKPTEAEVCHIYFIQSVEYDESAYIASTPPIGYTELPTCPVCLERLDQDTSGIQSTLCDHSFQCSCVSKWTYLACQVCRLCQQQDEKPACSVCGTMKNLCVCLICGFVGCGRYEKKHAIKHWTDAAHHYSLELETQQIWDYVGDKYVHRLNQSKGDSKLVTVDSRCTAAEGECTSCGDDEDSRFSGALFSSKVDSIVDEYNNLLASQLETQRQHYESLLAEARSGKESSISRAVEKAVFSKMNDLQAKIEMYTEETKSVAERNQVLLKIQELSQTKYRETAERERLLLKSKDEKKLDLKEQIRDLKVYVGAQRKLSNVGISDGKGGTVLSVGPNKQSSSSSRRRAKLGRRRN
ncbi:BRAP2 RING ZnF UBP domain-containing protein 1 [Solanum dulcamara]|uniref:BRAP2 RING ZnF UBP domain-containing protein 1 n=1 Tax=Solanum dulcamara TaxID=45834 RepID=UPI00248631EE|nr:BRAP2 RING ZnF UBP domain-containing protein 1 [Solanum dulcamara]